MSKREEMRRRRQAQTRQRMIGLIAAVVVLALAVTSWLIYQNVKPIGAIKAVPTRVYAQASGKTLGAPDAKVTLLLFSDFRCPACRALAQGVEDQIIAQFVDTGRARLEYHHYLIIDQKVGGRESRDAALASECAADQSQFWNFHNLLFANQGATEGGGAFEVRRLKALAESMGLDTAAFNQCLDSGRHAAEVTADEVLAAQFGVSGTPTVFVNGNKMANPQDLAEYERLITLQEQQ